MAQPQRMSVDGRQVRVTNLDKVLYPATGTTKGDVIDYYRQIADVMLPHCSNRPVTRKRWVHGVGTAEDPGEVFFQKNLDSSTPDWVARTTIEHKEHSNSYPLANDAATLVWLAQIAALEIHVPQWQVGTDGARNPDRLVLDLDPGPGAGLVECVEVAKMCRTILEGMDLEVFPVTSGSKGIHLYAGLDGQQTSQQVSQVAHELARALEADHRDLVVSDMKKSLRQGKVLVDWSQNSAAKTTIAPYSLRGRERPMVAAPRTWRELASPSLQHLDFKEVLRRMAKRGDPLAALSQGSPASPRKSSRAGGRSGSKGSPDSADPERAGVDDKDPLAHYRAKRDPNRTPEPFDSPEPAPGAAPLFVIQEHHARRLHHDFRLERDGVLVSWALPKGVPPDPAKNHLAVHTEDHPLVYGGFEGEIPKGEYGAGKVTIWDTGTYELEKWRAGAEVIATLHGRPGGGLEALGGGPVKVALINTSSKDGDAADAKNWLIHRMKVDPPGARPPTRTTRTAPAPQSGLKMPVQPMLASLSTESAVHDELSWAFEMKWDGIRALIQIRAEGAEPRLRIWTRNGNDITAAYPELKDLVEQVHVPAVLDGEIVALRNGRPDFELLQERFGLQEPRDIERARNRVPVDLMLFDVLEADGHDLRNQTYDARREALTMITSPQGRIHVPEAFDGSLTDALQTSHELRLEGVMAKEHDSTYSTGRRTHTWLKIKHARHQEVVIVGWRPGKGNRQGAIGSLLIAVPDDDGGLRYAGRVGTGLTERALAALGRLLKIDPDDAAQPHTAVVQPPATDVPRADARDAVWVEPELIGEVEFNQWTSSGRMRQPVWRGLRPDRTLDSLRT